MHRNTDGCVLAKENNAAHRSKLGCTQRTRYSTTEKNTILMRVALQQMTKERTKRKKSRSESVNCKFFCVEDSEKGKVVNWEGTSEVAWDGDFLIIDEGSLWHVVKGTKSRLWWRLHPSTGMYCAIHRMSLCRQVIAMRICFEELLAGESILTFIYLRSCADYQPSQQ